MLNAETTVFRIRIRFEMLLLDPDSHWPKTDPDPEAKKIDKNLWPSSGSRIGER